MTSVSLKFRAKRKCTAKNIQQIFKNAVYYHNSQVFLNMMERQTFVHGRKSNWLSPNIPSLVCVRPEIVNNSHGQTAGEMFQNQWTATWPFYLSDWCANVLDCLCFHMTNCVLIGFWQWWFELIVFWYEHEVTYEVRVFHRKLNKSGSHVKTGE